MTNPEERLLSPLTEKLQETQEVPPEALAQLSVIINLAVEARRISPQSAAWMKRILSVNPQRRLSRLGQRISVVEGILHDIAATDDRLQVAVELLREEHSILKSIIDLHPAWKVLEESSEKIA